MAAKKKPDNSKQVAALFKRNAELEKKLDELELIKQDIYKAQSELVRELLSISKGSKKVGDRIYTPVKREHKDADGNVIQTDYFFRIANREVEEVHI